MRQAGVQSLYKHIWHLEKQHENSLESTETWSRKPRPPHWSGAPSCSRATSWRLRSPERENREGVEQRAWGPSPLTTAPRAAPTILDTVLRRPTAPERPPSVHAMCRIHGPGCTQVTTEWAACSQGQQPAKGLVPVWWRRTRYEE